MVKSKAGTLDKIVQLRYISVALGILLIVLIYFGFESPFYAITSDSMSPTINRGDLVIAPRVYGGEVAEGDLIVFHSPLQTSFKYLTHRVTEVQLLSNGTAVIQTKGDANPEEDPFLLKDELIMGRVAAHIPAMGYALLTFSNPITLAVIIIFVLLAGLFISKGLKAEKAEKKRAQK
jgi:signal peptidase